MYMCPCGAHRVHSCAQCVHTLHSTYMPIQWGEHTLLPVSVCAAGVHNSVQSACIQCSVHTLLYLYIESSGLAVLAPLEGTISPHNRGV